MRIILVGAPGAGKGTQSTRILAKYAIPYISTGDIFRKEVSKDTDFGKEVQRYIDKGLLVPDHITLEIVQERLSQSDCKDSYLLDGFPRTVLQARMFDEIVLDTKNPVQVVINLDIKEDLLIERLTGRQICRTCGSIYHKVNKPSKIEGICDKCGSKLVEREDDKIENVKVRLREYRTRTKPLIDFYRKKGLLVNIDASQDADVIFEEISRILEGLQ